MAQLRTEQVTSVHHWTDRLFSFRTTRDAGFKFKNGHFTMIGLADEGKPLLRAYSIASANYEDELEFFSIKVPDGPLTSKLQNIRVGDEVLVNSKPTGTLVQDNLLPGRNLYLVGTGTGLAPFISIIKDPEIYDNYDHIVLAHGVRYASELAYQDLIHHELPRDEYLGETVKEKLLYYPTVTREPYRNTGRLTDLIDSGTLQQSLGLEALDPEQDRFMLCGSPSMLKDFCALLDRHGFEESRQGKMAHYAIERAFVES
ncbi:ferredoxin--NADP reductase [Parahalioglobus pacificus]|uniref:ferredoxin--NADP(+) reductase n=1 Tax=Parahalioglobus pacificus TaxID=930806 RepID=A0A918XE97_9GAMM|nr:ferredoxin--NADP reductase [Halioglobus pacificus]GHD27828.1 ferredoxin--NADP(+) reductase [Halioglobus pacificus]